MTFEYDENKSKTNKLKHSIDFEEAQELWQDEYALEFPSQSDIDEKRFLIVSKIDLHIFTAIITYRAENIRIISVRRAREKEIKVYESNRLR